MTVKLAFNRETLRFRADFRITGSQCRLSTNSYNVLRQAIPWQAPEECDNLPSFQMEIIEKSSLDSITGKLPHFRGVRHLVFVMLEPRSFLGYDLLRRRVIGVLSSAAVHDRSFWNGQLLPITIGILGTTLGVAPLHCACLDRSGNGLLLTGASGAGKSTLSAALAQRGFALVSDDWTYLARRQSNLTAHGLFAPIKLLPNSVQYFPELTKCVLKKTMNGEIAYEVDPARVLRSAVKTYSHPKWILFLERSAIPGCRFIPCRSEHVAQFFESNAERLPEELPLAKSARSEIITSLAGCQTWLLRTGDGPHRTAESVNRFLEEV
jgi:HPr Serine kinase C-terminal domain